MSLIAVDIGSSRIKALLATWDGRTIALDSRPTPRQEHAPGERSYPLDAVQHEIEALVAGLGARDPRSVDTLVFSCLGTAMGPVSAEGQPLAPALAPADLRPHAHAHRVADLGLAADDLRRRTGSDPAVASFLWHALWWQAEQPSVLDRAHRFRSLRGYAVAQLCDVDVEDRSWASRTMLAELETNEWSPRILAAAAWPGELLPALVPSTSAYPIAAEHVKRLGLARGARAVVGGMDNCCSLFGAAGPDRAGLVDIVGTYEHMAGAASLGAVRSIAAASGAIVHSYLLPDQYIAMTRVPIGDLLAEATAGSGQTLDELLDGLGPVPTGEALALDAAAVQLAVRASRAPADIIQGLVEASTVVLARFADAWAATGLPAEPIAVVGGGAGHEAALRLKATMLGRRLVTLASNEGAVIGALRLAAMAIQGATPAEACALFDNPIDRTIRPGLADASPPKGVS